MKVSSVFMILLLVSTFTGLQDVRADEADEAYKTGLRYYNGDGVKQDFTAAMEWFKKAADQGNAEAQCKIGSMYENGDGVPRDYAEAVKWYRKAADQGNAEAEKNIERLRQKINARKEMRKDLKISPFVKKPPREKIVGADPGNPPRFPSAAAGPPRVKRSPETVDEALKGLNLGNIAFNVPRAINFYETAAIQLRLSLATPIDKLKQLIEAVGEKEGASIQVSDRMEARLSGPHFTIIAITPEIQAVTETADTEWRWDVKPITEGQQILHLTLSVLIKVHGESTQRAIRTFDKQIEVKVTSVQQVVSFVKNNWQWLWAVIVLPVLGWLCRRRKGPKSSAVG
jgi:hypothetical protein